MKIVDLGIFFHYSEIIVMKSLFILHPLNILIFYQCIISLYNKKQIWFSLFTLFLLTLPP